ncbi:unnamed protein product [Discosporangium mesarthrocarpum]
MRHHRSPERLVVGRVLVHKLIFAIVPFFCGVGGTCPNQCSGHGDCGADNVCACETGWDLVADCALKSCPTGPSWGSKVCLVPLHMKPLCFPDALAGSHAFHNTGARRHQRSSSPAMHGTVWALLKSDRCVPMISSIVSAGLTGSSEFW